MYLCLCNCLREQEVSSVIADGASSIREVYGKLGCKPVCGKCVPYVRENMLSISGARPAQQGA